MPTPLCVKHKAPQVCKNHTGDAPKGRSRQTRMWAVSGQPTPGSLSCLGRWADPALGSLTLRVNLGTSVQGGCNSSILLFSVLKPLLDIFKPSECDSSASDKKHLDASETNPHFMCYKAKPILVSCVVDSLTPTSLLCAH